MFYDKREVLSLLADGKSPDVVYGPDRGLAAQELAAYVKGIEPTEYEEWAYALRPDAYLVRKVKAYRNGRAFIDSAYRGYVLWDLS